MPEWSDDELRAAAAGVRDRQFASFLSFAFCLACEQYPEQMAAALSGLPGFDFAAIAAQGERTLRIIHAVADEAQAVRYLCESVQTDVDRIESRISELEMRVDKAGQAMVRLAQECER